MFDTFVINSENKPKWNNGEKKIICMLHTAHIGYQRYFHFKMLMFIDVSLILIKPSLFHRVEQA